MLGCQDLFGGLIQWEVQGHPGDVHEQRHWIRPAESTTQDWTAGHTTTRLAC
jgi:hypothetical protein